MVLEISQKVAQKLLQKSQKLLFVTQVAQKFLEFLFLSSVCLVIFFLQFCVVTRTLNKFVHNTYDKILHININFFHFFLNYKKIRKFFKKF